MDYTAMPVRKICDYLWDLAEGNVAGSTRLPTEVWKIGTDNIRTKIIAPISEKNIPNDLGGKTPFILYDFLYTGVDPTCFPLIKEEATLTIVGELLEVYPLKNFIYDALSKFDISAFEINNHIRDTGINFKYIKARQEQYSLDEKKTVITDSGEGTRYATTLYITYEYSRS
jgi:hypothetical protein